MKPIGLVLLPMMFVVAGCSAEDIASRTGDAAEKIQNEIIEPMTDAVGRQIRRETGKDVGQHVDTVAAYISSGAERLDDVAVDAIQSVRSGEALSGGRQFARDAARRLADAVENGGG